MRILVFVLMLLGWAVPAYAYMGPGSGMAFIAVLVSLLAAVGLGMLGFVWYPIKRLMRAIRGRNDESQA